jgi:hypothetical protein
MTTGPASAGDRPAGPVEDIDRRWADPAYRAGVVDLLGAVAYGELSAYLRLSSDAELAPTLGTRVELARLAALEFQHFELLCGRLDDVGADPERAMEPFMPALDAFHERTNPATWHESLVKYYVGDAIASDFYREISAHLDDATRDLILNALDSPGKTEFVVKEVLTATGEDPVLASRLSLWARRLVGEALSQGQRVAADRDSFSALMMGFGDAPGMGLVGIVGMFGRITEQHTKRMAQLGLSA